jgi:hypothetical protein
MAKKRTSRGLGDTIEKVTKATGIKWIVGECEECDKRKAKLNELFRYKPTKGCINESEYNFLKETVNKETLKLTEQMEIQAIVYKVWGYKPTFSVSCPPCNQSIMQDLKTLIKVYEE